MNAGLKSRQFCSVCKEWLEMEIVPTSDGDDDDGVIWYRCPQCQGFLPKLKSALETEETAEQAAEQSAEQSAESSGDATAVDVVDDDAMEYDSPSAMMEAEKKQAQEEDSDPLLGENLVETPDKEPAPVAGGFLPEDDDPDPAKKTEKKAEAEAAEKADPIQEYAAMLAEVDPVDATPYRPWAEYEEGQCIHHLAWDDCGVVVAKETLPGNRSIIKVYFETAGVIRLIEKAPR